MNWKEGKEKLKEKGGKKENRFCFNFIIFLSFFLCYKVISTCENVRYYQKDADSGEVAPTL